MKLIQLIVMLLYIFVSFSLSARLIDFEKKNKIKCYKVFQESDSLNVSLRKDSFEGMTNIFIAKITNNFFVKEKKIEMNFEILANLKGNFKNFKLDTTYLYGINPKIELKKCSLLLEASFSSHPRIMLISLYKKTNNINESQSAQNLIKFSKNAIGMYVDDTGNEILTGINKLDIDSKSHNENIKSLKESYKLFLSQKDNKLIPDVQLYKAIVFESKYKGVEVNQIKVNKNDIEEFKKYKIKQLVEEISNEEKLYKESMLIYKNLKAYGSFFNPFLKNSSKVKAIVEENIKLNQQLERANSFDVDEEYKRKIQEIFPEYKIFN